MLIIHINEKQIGFYIIATVIGDLITLQNSKRKLQ